VLVWFFVDARLRLHVLGICHMYVIKRFKPAVCITAIAALAPVGMTLTANAANAATEIGSARKVVNSVTGALSGQKRNLSRGARVHLDERISAAANSSAQMIFNDGTRLAVGARASVVLDKFVYAGAGSGSMVLNAAQGAFRFVTGKMPSRSYKIQTPASTIGVRGTMFDVFVGARGETIVVLLRGETDVCNRANRCHTLRDRCDAVRVEPSGQMITGRGLSDTVLGDNRASSVVPFMYYQRPLVRSLRAPEHTIKTCLGASHASSLGPDRNGEAPDRPDRPDRPDSSNDQDDGPGNED
jgi:hypothetical protein